MLPEPEPFDTSNWLDKLLQLSECDEGLLVSLAVNVGPAKLLAPGSPIWPTTSLPGPRPISLRLNPPSVEVSRVLMSSSSLRYVSSSCHRTQPGEHHRHLSHCGNSPYFDYCPQLSDRHPYQPKGVTQTERPTIPLKPVVSCVPFAGASAGSPRARPPGSPPRSDPYRG